MANGQIKGVGNAGNDRANCYQTVTKGWKLVLRWMVYLLQGSLLWVGKSGYEKPLRSPRKSLKSQNRYIIGADNGYWVSVFGVIRLVLGMFYAVLL